MQGVERFVQNRVSICLVDTNIKDNPPVNWEAFQQLNGNLFARKIGFFRLAAPIFHDGTVMRIFRDELINLFTVFLPREVQLKYFRIKQARPQNIMSNILCIQIAAIGKVRR